MGPRNMSASCLEVIKNTEIIALNQDKLVSRAKLVYQWPDTVWPQGVSSINITMQAWAKPLADGSVGVVVFNRGAYTTGLTLIWSMVGLPKGARVMVRDLWK